MTTTKDKGPCSYEGCGRPAYSRGLCASHHSQMHRRGWLGPIGEPCRPKTVRPCEVPDRWTLEPCGEDGGGQGVCPRHLAAYRSLVAG